MWGKANPVGINTLALQSMEQNLLGLIVWYASTISAFQYDEDYDSSTCMAGKMHLLLQWTF